MLRANTHYGSIMILAITGWIGAHAPAPRRITPPPAPEYYLRFDGMSGYVEVPSATELGVGPAGLTVAVWMRPDELTFPKTEGSRPTEQYVHWLGKGERGAQEWTFRMYSQTTPAGPRANRISFYVFNPDGGRGCGSYFQDAIVAGQWIHVVGVVDPTTHRTAIYKNGELRHQDNYGGIINPAPGSAPLRIGTKDLTSFFGGAIGPVYLWSRALSATEVQSLYQSGTAPPSGLVARYAMSEGSGSTIHDSQGKHDGTDHGATWGEGRGSIASGAVQSGGGC